MGQAAGAATRADLLIRGIDWLITVDDARRVIRGAAIAIRDGRFAALGKTADIERAWRAECVIEARGTVCTPGLIDSGYRDELRVILVNTDPSEAFEVRRGDRIAQLVVQRVEQCRFAAVESLPDSSRGLGGFGSTGT